MGDFQSRFQPSVFVDGKASFPHADLDAASLTISKTNDRLIHSKKKKKLIEPLNLLETLDLLPVLCFLKSFSLADEGRTNITRTSDNNTKLEANILLVAFSRCTLVTYETVKKMTSVLTTLFHIKYAVKCLR